MKNKLRNQFTLIKTAIIFLVLFGLCVFVSTRQNASADNSPESNILSGDLSGDTQLLTERTGNDVRINGSGFQKFEQVTITVELINDVRRDNDLLAKWSVFADAEGSIVSQWRIPFDGKFIIKTIGNETDSEAQTTIDSASVPPIFVSGNVSCAGLNADNATFPTIVSDYGFKVDSNASGTFTLTNGPNLVLTGGAPSDPGNSVTTNVSGSTLTSWSATLGIDAVIVKGGPNSNVYVYNPESMGDTTLVTAGGGVSHIEFCYDYEAKLRIIKNAVPNASTDFTFNTTNLPVANFTLDDDAGAPGEDGTFSNFIDFTITNFGAANQITVTENSVPGWTLTNIACVEDSGGPPQSDNSTTSIGLRRATIIAEQGEMITCTFTNEIVLAAGASIDGTITDAFGRGAPNVLVRATDLDSGETRFTITNPFGRYRIGDLQVGGNYIVRVSSKRYVFSPDSIVITLNDDAVGVDFIAELE